MRLPPTAVLAALTAVLIAACGGSSKPSSSGSSSSSHRKFAAANFEKYPGCMRSHGVSSFPDAVKHGNTVQLKVNPTITESAAFNSAQRACGHLLPARGQFNGGGEAQVRAREEGLLAFASCVRTHGFPSFPDPTSQGQLTVQMITQAGINLQQPAVQQVGDACVPVSHGTITKADVERAVSGGGGGG